MDFSTTYSVNNLGEVPVVAQADGVRRIVVQENFNSSTPPTADLLQRGRLTGSTQINVPKGTPAIFTSPNESGYAKGQQAGTIETVSGSIIVLQGDYLSI